MRIGKYLGDVLSGRISHWNRVHNTVVAEIFNKSKQLAEEGGKFFKLVLVHSNFVVDSLILPKDDAPLLKLELSSITRNQIEDLYSILLAFFAAKASQVVPQLKERMQEDLLAVVPNPTTAESFFTLLATEVVPDVETVRLCRAVTRALSVTDQDFITEQLIHSLCLLMVSQISRALVTGARDS